MNYTQELYLCALKPKGSFGLSDNIYALLSLSGILELLEGGFLIKDEKNRLSAKNNLGSDLPYLKSLYENIISCKKPTKIETIVSEYNDGFGKHVNAFLQDIGDSLAEQNAVSVETSKKIFGGTKNKYLPVQSSVTNVIEKIRAEILEDGTMSEETVVLAILLQQANIIKDFFSKVESSKLKKRVEELRQSETYKEIAKVIEYIESLLALVVLLPMLTSTTNSN